MMLHALERFFIHFFSSAGLLLVTAFVVRFIGRKKTKWTFWPTRKYQVLAFSAILILPLVFLREPYDVSSADPVWKSYTDLISWLCGIVISFWGLYRWDKWNE